jgi:hypothetical protein
VVTTSQFIDAVLITPFNVADVLVILVAGNEDRLTSSTQIIS